MLKIPLDAAFQVRSHSANGQEHFPHPAGHTAFDAAQDTVGFLGCECSVGSCPASHSPLLPCLPGLTLSAHQGLDITVNIIDED